MNGGFSPKADVRVDRLLSLVSARKRTIDGQNVLFEQGLIRV